MFERRTHHTGLSCGRCASSSFEFASYKPRDAAPLAVGAEGEARGVGGEMDGADDVIGRVEVVELRAVVDVEQHHLCGCGGCGV